MRNQQKCCCRDSSSEAQIFVLKVAPNHGNRCGELPKAIPCNALSWKTIGSFTFVCKAWNCSYFFQIVASPHSIPVAIPSRYPSGAWMLTSPSCSWTREKRSRDVPHTWPALSKNPKYDPVIMNTGNFNLIYIYCIYIHHIYIYMTYIYIWPVYILLITISYVHAPNTVKRYSELRIAILKSKRVPFTYWILHACIYMYIYMCECVISSIRLWRRIFAQTNCIKLHHFEYSIRIGWVWLCPAGCELQLQLPVSKELLTSSKHVGVLILLLCAEKEKQTSCLASNGLHTHATGHSSGWVTHCCSRSGRHPLVLNSSMVHCGTN